ncbi:NACHT domain-containing protein [Microbispora bryophytorum]|uniref:NACHT domain-containing protein n=1 Tax=Microbispora bryophytorum TaxID=1460882 RepID=UPI0033FBAC50
MLPESRFKYLYERLGDHNFQLLVTALLTSRFTDFQPLPLRQADGGRDGVSRGSNRSLVYQVKWSVNGHQKNPVSWLESTVKGEEENLRRLVREGSRKYVLVTNVPSTGAPGSGTFDQLNDRLDKLAEAYGFDEMSCLWRESVDGMVDNAPRELRWQYADMLAGWDLVRYLIAEDVAVRHDAGLRKLIRSVAATQWGEDERVKFSQVDIDREKVVDLFVDVTADHLVTDRAVPQRQGERPQYFVMRSSVGGAAAHLLEERRAGDLLGTVVRGAPGQGKSTLSQFVSQAYRSAFIPDPQRPAGLPKVELPRFPVRFDLSDYARWASGVDVWDTDSDAPKKARKRSASQSTIECFIAELMSHASGGTTVTPMEVQDLFSLLPCIVVLDGLDEVGRATVREKVVAEIDHFASRNRGARFPPRMIVTTRPSTNELPEPSAEYFDTVVLKPLDSAQRTQYLQKWTAVHGISGAEGRALRKVYKEKISEPYLDELAGNPMQLTILLDLLHKHGDATPTQRTALYDAYVDLLLAREANKHPKSVRKHQDDLREIIPFLGWHLHAHAEADRDSSRMSVRDLKASIRHFQRTYGNPESIVDELFEAATDRLWALTSKTEGSYEFEVLSLREYFAARFLYKYAGEETKGFDRLEVFRELLRRPYWLNTARFYGGNAKVGDVSELADGIIDELADDPAPHSIIAGWTLLTDGVFTTRPRRARDVLTSLGEEQHLPKLVAALDRGEISPLPALPQPSGSGPDPTWIRITERLAADPGCDDVQLNVAVLRQLLNQRAEFATWWGEHVARVVAACRPAHTIFSWIEMAARSEAAAGLDLDLAGLDLEPALVAQFLLDTGVVPPAGSTFEAELEKAVLNGLCPNVRSVRSTPAQIAVAFAPESFISSSPAGFGDSAEERVRRQEALKRLRASRPDLAAAAAHRRFGKGERGSTFPWAKTAAALFDAVGPCWLVTQIAVLGAAAPHQLGVVRQPGKAAFGKDSHPAALLELSRANAGSVDWWRAQRSSLSRDVDLAAWCIASWCVAEPSVVEKLCSDWEATFLGLPEVRRRPVVDIALRCSAAGWLGQLSATRSSSDRTVTALLESRNSKTPTHDGTSIYRPRTTRSYKPLIEVARERQWFKVDAVGVYR